MGVVPRDVVMTVAASGDVHIYGGPSWYFHSGSKAMRIGAFALSTVLVEVTACDGTGGYPGVILLVVELEITGVLPTDGKIRDDKIVLKCIEGMPSITTDLS